MRRVLVAAAAAAFVAVLSGGCGGSSRPKGPPDLLFVSTKDGDYAIYGADGEGKHEYRLSPKQEDVSSPAALLFQTEPAWSPDSGRVAFVSRREDTAHVFTMAIDGTGTKRVTAGNQSDSHPTWSPDGKWILFSREGALFRVPAPGGTATRVGHGLGSAQNPAYSPDGTKIAYDYRIPSERRREIWMMNADGTGSHRVTDLRSTSAYPSWSPDGKQIAFQSNALAGRYDIYTVAASGGSPKRVSAAEADGLQPAWGFDGRIAFSRDGAIWTYARGEEKQLTSSDDNASAPAWRPVRPQ